MATFPAAGINQTIDRFIAVYQGSVVYVSAVDVEILTSSKRIPVAGLDMVAILPTAEAFASIRAMPHSACCSLRSYSPRWWLP